VVIQRLAGDNRIGARPRSMGSCRSSASSFPNALSPAIFGASNGGAILESRVKKSKATIASR